MILNHQHSGKTYPKTICRLNGKDIDNVTTFLYLGCCMKYDEPDTGNAEIELRIDSAENALYRYSKKVLQSFYCDQDQSKDHEFDCEEQVGIWLSDMGTDEATNKKNEVDILGNSS